MKQCPIHRLSYQYTCPACEESWAYVGHPNLIPFFNSGVTGGPLWATTVEEKAAYEAGAKYRVKEKEHGPR